MVATGAAAESPYRTDLSAQRLARTQISAGSGSDSWQWPEPHSGEHLSLCKRKAQRVSRACERLIVTTWRTAETR